jgi:acetate kinase
MDAILAVNAGSSSLKFQLFALVGEDLARRVRGQLDGIGTRPRLRASGADGAALVDRTWPAEAVADLPAAIAEVRSWLQALPGVSPQKCRRSPP